MMQNGFQTVMTHILVYAKNKEIWRPNLLPTNWSKYDPIDRMLSNYRDLTSEGTYT